MATLSELRNLFRFGTDFTVVTPTATFQTAVGQNILEPTDTTAWTDLWALPGGGGRQHQDFNVVIQGNTAITTGQVIFEGAATLTATAINLDYYNTGAPSAPLQGAVTISSAQQVQYSVINPLKLRYVRARISTVFAGTTTGTRALSVDYSAKTLFPQIFRNIILNTVNASLSQIGGTTVTASAGAPTGGTQRIVVATGSTGATTSVASVTTATSLLAASASRLGATIYNESTSNLSVLLGAGTVSNTVYTVRIAPNGYYQVPSSFAALKVDGIWSAANGSARITTVA
jgi:hypothetical protein